MRQGRERAAHPPMGAGWRGAAAWCLFDWANSPFPTVIVTFVFGVYFQRGIVGDEVRATALWGNALAVSAFVVAVLAPFFGAAADAAGRRKPWLLACAMVTIVATAGLWTATPVPESIWRTLILVAVANIGFELGMVFYNAMLPDLAPADRVGRLSGWAWGLGYFGGLACLVVTLFGLVQTDTPPFGLDPAEAEPVRAAAILVAVWFVVFGWPMFAFTPDRPDQGLGLSKALAQGWRRLGTGIAYLRQAPNMLRFLIARMIYIDGLNTLFAFGGIYAAGSFGMEMIEVLQFGIALNIAAGIGAVGFAWVDDWIGAKRTIVISLLCLIGLGVAILSVESKVLFWGLGLAIGIFMGPVQSASRSLMARLAPEELCTEMFGVFALTGKATAFVGPWLVGALTVLGDSQRVGMASIVVFFAVGLVLLLSVVEPDAGQRASVGSGERP